MSNAKQVVIIGAGHNGLVAAFYLAQAGLKPLLLEQRPIVGGAAITEELHPGFKSSTLAHASGPLDARVVEDLRLERQGLLTFRSDPRVFAPAPDGRALLLFDDPAKSARALAGFSKKDAEKFSEFQRALSRLAGLLRRVMAQTPPAIDSPSTGDYWNMAMTARAFRGLGKKDMYRLLRWGPMPIADLVSEWFEHEILRATIAARAIFGTFLGPRSAGTTAAFLLRAAADPHPAAGGSYVRGGLGSLTQALAAAATESGAQIRTGAHVARLSIQDGAVSGVVLSSGEEIAAQIVVSNADPRRTFLRFIDPVHLEPEFLTRVNNYRCLGTVAKVNLALAGLPTFTALAQSAAPEATGALSGRIHLGPELDYLERAFDDAKYGGFSRYPILDVAIPSLTDSALAPPGQHVMSIYVQFAPYKLKHGEWNGQREALGDAVVKTLSTYAPDLPGLILHRQVITPQDLEETYGLTGGHIFHGELALDQVFALRPLLGWARYRTPIHGLYLCGSGTHPGNGLTGLSGANAAREILKDLR